MECNARYYNGGTWITPLLWANTILRTISKHGLIIGSWEDNLWQERENKYVIIISMLLHQYVNKVYYWAHYFVRLLHPTPPLVIRTSQWKKQCIDLHSGASLCSWRPALRVALCSIQQKENTTVHHWVHSIAGLLLRNIHTFSFYFFSQLYWDIIDIYLSLRYTTWSDTHIYCKNDYYNRVNTSIFSCKNFFLVCSDKIWELLSLQFSNI